jgi:hypothetical protein
MASNQSGKTKTNYSNAAASSITFVPQLSDFFGTWPTANGPDGKPWNGKLTRTWILFFQSLISQATAAPPIVGWWMPGVAPATANLPALASGRGGDTSQVVVVIVASDALVNLSFDILQNGASIFETPPVIAAATAAGELPPITNLVSTPLTVEQDDVFTFNMIAGSTSWFFSAQLENAILPSQ